MDLAKSLALTLPFHSIFLKPYENSVFEYCGSFFFYPKGSLSNGGFLIECVYIVMNFRQLRNYTASVEIASRFHGVNFSLLYTIPYWHCFAFFLSLIFWKVNVELVAFPPPLWQSHSLFLRKLERTSRIRRNMVFQNSKVVWNLQQARTYLLSPVRSPIWLTCYLTPVCVRHTSSIYFPFKGICQTTVFS